MTTRPLLLFSVAFSANAAAGDSDPTFEEIVLASEQAGEAIEIHGEAPAAAAGAEKLDRDELQRIPGTGNDVVRTLSAMPGVVNAPLPLGFSGMVIRGAAPQDSKILIDDFEVPALYHDIAFRSIVPAEAIDSLEYIPGGFDVAYGRAGSGLVALTTRPGAAQRSEQVEVSAIDGGVLAQGSAGSRTTYMLAFRRSLIDLILPELIPSDADLSLTTVPRYYDEQLRIDHQLSDRWQLRVSSIGSDDELGLFTDAAHRPDKRFYTHTRFLRLTTAARYHDGPWSAQLALSGMVAQNVVDLGVDQNLDARQSSVTARGEAMRTLDELAGLRDVAWRFGGEMLATHSAIDLALPVERLEGEPMQNLGGPTGERFHGVVWAPDLAAWTAVAAALDPAIHVTTGLRVDRFMRIDQTAVQPRGELQIKLAPSLTARFDAGAYVRPPEFQSELLDKTLRPERSTQTILGVQYEPRTGVRIQGSLYATDRTDLIVHAADGVTLVNDGRGTTYGAELLTTVRAGPWFGWLSYAYSRSTRVDTPGGTSRLFDYDQPHSLNAAASYRWRAWQVGARFQLYSGLPYTPVTGAVYESDANTYLPIFGAINSERAPIHHELDLRVDRWWKWSSGQLAWFLDVQNVYLNQSTVEYFYSYDYSQRSAFVGLPIIPSTGLRGVL
jgi:outer membrane receptor protein involved in Fe transport